MTTLTLSTSQVSTITFVPAGSRITSDGNGSIEWTPGSPIDAANSPNWQTWAKGSSAGYMDTLRPMSIRATATGSMTVTIEEGRGDKYGEDAYFDADYAQYSVDTSGNVTGLVGGNGSGVLKGPMVNGEWFSCPSIFRLRLTGTGSVTVDSKDSLGNITTSVASYTVSGATDQIEFPYAGNNAVAIRATLTGDATCEVI